MKTPPANKIHPAFWLAIMLAIVATSCASNPNHPVSTDNGWPVKGATLLMDHSR